jgi:hypothetical protein
MRRYRERFLLEKSADARCSALLRRRISKKPATLSVRLERARSITKQGQSALAIACTRDKLVRAPNKNVDH